MTQALPAEGRVAGQLDLFSSRGGGELFADIPAHIRDEFWAFHHDNPQIFELFRAYCTDLRRAGREAYGAKAVIERIRWHLNVEVRSADDLKLNNNYTSCYARLLVEIDPSFASFFRLRRGKGGA